MRNSINAQSRARSQLACVGISLFVVVHRRSKAKHALLYYTYICAMVVQIVTTAGSCQLSSVYRFARC
jgi:hypothetical protein